MMNDTIRQPTGAGLGLPGGAGVGGDDITCEGVQCGAARAASQTEGQMVTGNYRLSSVRSACCQLQFFRFNQTQTARIGQENTFDS